MVRSGRRGWGVRGNAHVGAGMNQGIRGKEGSSLVCGVQSVFGVLLWACLRDAHAGGAAQSGASAAPSTPAAAGSTPHW